VTGTNISLVGLTRRFGPTVAVDELSIDIAARSFTALLGPSGCGKSTTLAMVAGLLEPDRGDVCFNGRSIRDVPAERRPIGVVFQRPLLFPHLSVADNIGFGLRMRRVARPLVRDQVAQMLDRVQLSAFAGRRVGELSGGQEQRVALARALILQPQVLLLDEPFSQLDVELRVEMRRLVRQLHDHDAVTTVFVTHDQAEAVDVADSVVLMLDGRLAGQGPPEMFFTNPPTLAAARFFGVANEIHGSVKDGTFTCPGTPLRVNSALADGPGIAVVRPEALRLVGSGRGDTVSGVAVEARFAGTHLAVRVDAEGIGRLTVHHRVGDPVRLGERVHVQVPASSCTVLPEQPPATPESS